MVLEGVWDCDISVYIVGFLNILNEGLGMYMLEMLFGVLQVIVEWLVSI